MRESRSCVPQRRSTGALIILERGEAESICEARVRPGWGWFGVMGMLSCSRPTWVGEGLLENAPYSLHPLFLCAFRHHGKQITHGLGWVESSDRRVHTWDEPLVRS